MARQLIARALTFVSLLSWATGCVSVDPRQDLERAASLVEERSPISPAWTVLGEDDPDAWDGQSPLRMEAAVHLALRNNPALRAELESIAAARADLVQSGLLPNPVLSVALRLPLQSGIGQVEATGVQDLASLLLRGRRRGAAQAELERTVQSVSDRALRLVADVKAAHAGVVYGQRAVELTRENLALVDRSIELTESRIRAGEASKLDVNRLRQLRLGLQAELQREEKELGKRKRELLLVLGLADGTTTWIAEAGEDPRAEGLGEERVVELVQQQRLDVAAARFAVAARRQELGIAEKAPFTGIGAGFSYTSEDADQFLGPELELSVPIFDTGQARVAKAQALLRAEVSRARGVFQEAVSKARAAFLELRSAEQLVRFYRESVLVLAEENLVLAEQAVRAGQDDQTVLLEAQRELVAARRTLNQLEGDRSFALSELEYAVGGNLDRSQEEE